jgi:hypothetical protein
MERLQKSGKKAVEVEKGLNLCKKGSMGKHCASITQLPSRGNLDASHVSSSDSEGSSLDVEMRDDIAPSSKDFEEPSG